jgi:hypothetical protein
VWMQSLVELNPLSGLIPAVLDVNLGEGDVVSFGERVGNAGG